MTGHSHPNESDEYISGDRTITRAELDRQTLQGASGFKSLGLGPGSCVALLLRNDFTFLEATNAARAIDIGFHPTALFAGFGAAATAAHLLRLAPKQLAQAWGLMLSMAGGSMQFSQEPEGTTVKRLHGGYAALHGVLAAEHGP